MLDVVGVLLVVLAAVSGFGLLLLVSMPKLAQRSGVRAFTARVRATLDASIDQLGMALTAVVVACAGWAVTLIVGLPIGGLAHALEPWIDKPVFRWIAARQVDGWSDIWREITKMGNSSITRPLAVVAGVVIAVLWATRGMRWWVPLVAFPLGYAMEAYGQVMLKFTVHRGHPPTDRGTYPSGGCARVIVVYGLIFVLLLLWWHRPVSMRAWAGAISLTLLATSIEGYARIYNQEHWFTDVIGGIVFGFLTLGATVACVFVLTRDRPRRHRDPVATRSTPSRIADARS